MRYILVSGLIALMGLGIGISCSKDDGISGRRLVGTKPAVGSSNYADFHPQTNVNYDPFAEMTRQERKAALGGSEGAIKHLQVVARHVAQAMRNKDVRELLHRVVPKDKEGDVHLFQIMMDNPAFFSLVSEGFKDAVSNKGIDASLSTIIGDTPSNLFLNFDEDSPLIRDTSLSLEQGLTPVERLWAYWQNTLRSISLTTPAYAHSYGPSHESHSSLVAPVHSIRIYDTNEGWGGGDPEVYVKIKIRTTLQGNHYYEDRFDLPNVNEVNVTYTEYAGLRSSHGVHADWNNNRIKEHKVMESDFPSADDTMGKWVNIHLPLYDTVKLLGTSTSVEGQDARVKIMKHSD